MFAVYSINLSKFYAGKVAGREMKDAVTGKTFYWTAARNLWTANKEEAVSFPTQDIADQFAELIADDLKEWGMDGNLIGKAL